MSESNQKAKKKVARALSLIAQAQSLLSEACGELCPIKGASDQWEAVGDHMDLTKALWHQVNGSIDLEKIEIDKL